MAYISTHITHDVRIPPPPSGASRSSNDGPKTRLGAVSFARYRHLIAGGAGKGLSW